MGATTNGQVIEELALKDKPNQLWQRDNHDAQGYFTLENKLEFRRPQVLTAIPRSGLEIKGDITLR